MPITQSEFEKQAAAVDQSILSDVYVPAFIKLAADRGVAIRTQEDLDNALKIVDMVEQYEMSSHGNLLKSAADDLQKLVAGNGQTKQASVKLAGVDELMKQAWESPEIRNLAVTGTELLLAKQTGQITA